MAARNKTRQAQAVWFTKCPTCSKECRAILTLIVSDRRRKALLCDGCRGEVKPEDAFKKVV